MVSVNVCARRSVENTRRTPLLQEGNSGAEGASTYKSATCARSQKLFCTATPPALSSEAAPLRHWTRRCASTTCSLFSLPPPTFSVSARLPARQLQKRSTSDQQASRQRETDMRKNAHTRAWRPHQTRWVVRLCTERVDALYALTQH